MKTKNILVMSALLATFTACNDEFDGINQGQEQSEGRLIELSENFSLIGNLETLESRGQWLGSSTLRPTFVWHPALSSGTTYNLDKIALAWTGVGVDENGNVDASGAIATPTDKVFTNYKFAHYAWKKKGVEPTIDNCTNDYLPTTIAYVKDATSPAGTINNEDATVTYASAATFPGLPANNGDIDPQAGMFNTSNSTVFAGQYIVSYPYDENNTSNYVKATSKDLFDFSVKAAANAYTKNDAMENIQDEIFMAGTAVLAEGGVQSSEFGMKNVSGFLVLDITSKAGVAANGVKKIILYSANKQFVTSVDLSAKAILEGKKGTQLYMAGTEETTDFVTVLTDPAKFKVGTGIGNPAKTNQYLMIPLLPTVQPIQDLKVILVNENNKALDYTWSGNTTIPAGGYATNGSDSKFVIENVDFSSPAAYNLVTDYDALKAAITTAISSGVNTTIKVMGNIVLTDGLNINNTNDATVVVTGGKLIVPAAKPAKKQFKVRGDSDSNNQGLFKFESDIDVEAGCCGRKGGELMSMGNVEFAGNVNIGVSDSNNPNVNTNDDALFTVYANKSKNVISGTLNNYGIFDVQAGSIQTNLEISGTVNNYKELTVKTDAVDARVTVSGTYNNKANAVTDVYGVINVPSVGTANNEGQIIDHVGAYITGNQFAMATGATYISEVDQDGTRFDDALWARPTTTVRFVNSAAQTFDMSKVMNVKTKSSITTYEVKSTGNVTFNGGAADAVLGPVTIDVEIPSLVITSGAVKLHTVKASTTNIIKLTADNITINGGSLESKAGTSDMAVSERYNTWLTVNETMTVNAGGTLNIYKNFNAKFGKFVLNGTSATIKGIANFGINSITDTNEISMNGKVDLAQASNSNESTAIVYYPYGKLTEGSYAEYVAAGFTQK